MEAENRTLISIHPTAHVTTRCIVDFAGAQHAGLRDLATHACMSESTAQKADSKARRTYQKKATGILLSVQRKMTDAA